MNQTILYNEKNLGATYILLFYYSTGALLGSDYLPTKTNELFTASALILVGAIGFGVLVG